MNLFAPPRFVDRLEDCFFYHALDLPGFGLNTVFANNPVVSIVNPYSTGSGSSAQYQNKKQFQIISAGRNRQFGPGGAGWQTGAGTAYDPETGLGGDDLSNFNTGLLNKVNQ